MAQRLDTCARKGALSTSDLAAWFDLPYATVKCYRQGTQPQTARREQIEQRLQWLERAVRTDGGLPVPLSVRASQRKAHLAGVLERVRRKR